MNLRWPTLRLPWKTTRSQALTRSTESAGYLSFSRTLTFGLLAALPLLIIYEVGIALLHSGTSMQVVNGVDALIEKMVTFSGLITPTQFTLLLILGITIGLAVAISRNKPQFKKQFFVFMFLEALLLSFLLGPLSNWILHPGASFQISSLSLPDFSNFASNIVLSFGAGFYEELLFRVMLVGGLVLLLRRFSISPVIAILISVIVSSLIFSGIHHIGPLGESFTLSAFLYRSVAGGILAAIYVLRGFGVAAWSHALYDVWVMTEVL